MNPLKRLSEWYFSRKALPCWGVLAMDCAAVYVSGILVYCARHGGLSLAVHFWQVTAGLMACLVVYAVSFFAFHTCSGILRYSSFVDLHKVAYSTAAAGAGVCLLHQLQVRAGLTPFILVPRFGSAVLMFVAATMMMWGLRVAVKYVYDTFRGGGGDGVRGVFIYGGLRDVTAIAKSLCNETPRRYLLRGFVSTDETSGGTRLMGVRVYQDGDSVVETMKGCGASALIVSSSRREHFSGRTALVDALTEAGVKILVTASEEEWYGRGGVSRHRLREIGIEDLLSRERIEVDMGAIGSMLRGRRVLITGAAGSIGSEMARQVAMFSPSELVLVDQAETPMHDMRLFMAERHGDVRVETIVTDICRKERMEGIFREYAPEYVFHAAAYKHVPMMEDNPAEAVQNNVFGTRVVADLSVRYGVRKFVMVSTDKAVNPTNVMGCSKRICEIYCQSLNRAVAEGEVRGVTQFVTTRFGNVLGSNGSVVPLFREQIRRGGPVTVTHKDMTRYFMLIPEACRLVLEAGTMGKGGEIFVFDMGEPVRIADLARRMIDLSGAGDVEIRYVGLRDGEKLYEEVLNDAERTVPTCHPKIRVAAVREYPYGLALRNEEELYRLSLEADDMAVVRKMKEIVPEYRSRHSKYEALDGQDI